MSIGTGFKQVKDETPDPEPDQLVMTRGVTGYYKQIISIVNHQVECNMNPQKIWAEFIKNLPQRELEHRFMRLNVEVSDLPRLDQVEKMPELGELADNYCKKRRAELQIVATRLVASLFYMRLTKVMENPHSMASAVECEGNTSKSVC